MGSSSSKFRKHLQNGDEYAALQLYNSSSELRKGLDPNSSYGDTHNHDTPLHLAARFAMKSLLRIFLNELGGNPNKQNSHNETSLHALCICYPSRCEISQQRRLESMHLLLQWRGPQLSDGDVERINLHAQDDKKNTALHYAASFGFQTIVELLVIKNSPLFLENDQKQTPCDCAEKNSFSSIALYLESKMVFTNVEIDSDDNLDEMLDDMEKEEAYHGLRTQDLQEAKDQLLVETADMLQVPLFTAEALLRNHEWSREMLLEAWIKDPIKCCEICGVVPPEGLFQEKSFKPELDSPTFEDSPSTSATNSFFTPDSDYICDICTSPVSHEVLVKIDCDHLFCQKCWERYLNGRIQEGNAHNITCPGFGCTLLVPIEIIETLVSRDMARRYLQFDIRAFVDSNPTIKWCPFPGCGLAVRLPEHQALSPNPSLFNSSYNDFSQSVSCSEGHMFCWQCLGEAHEPASCEAWNQWHKKIAEIEPEKLSGTEEESEMAANCLWLVTNSKPCTNCKSPIQKNEGCNHMKCSKCKHDFCWVCLEPWKKHGSSTGGYFRCNRYEIVGKVDETANQKKSQAEAHNKRMQELNRFVHYYTRFKNHENSHKLEVPLLDTAKQKMLILARAVSDPETANAETKFIEDSVQQLLKARHVLKCSYAYGYQLSSEAGYKKTIFEFMQTELEESTESLSEMVARPYLRTPRSKIIQTAHFVQRKRSEFVTAIAKGLIPPDNSPNLRRRHNKYNVELDDETKKALIASMKENDPSNPWVKDPSGRHTNVTALLDWPQDTDEESESSKRSADAELCSRKDCIRSCVKNPRTDEFHNYCSLHCMRLNQIESKHGNNEMLTFEANSDGFTDYQMDLLRALEMSRLQILREMASHPTFSNPPINQLDKKVTVNKGSSDLRSTKAHQNTRLIPRDPLVSSHSHRCDRKKVQTKNPNTRSRNHQSVVASLSDEDIDLKMAIELSLRDVKEQNQEIIDERETHRRSNSSCTPDPLLSNSGASFSQNSISEYSSVVQRIPNKSVEDLRLKNNHAELPSQSSYSQEKFKNVKKDLTINNMLLKDCDKTKNFADKNFGLAYNKKNHYVQTGAALIKGPYENALTDSSQQFSKFSCGSQQNNADHSFFPAPLPTSPNSFSVLKSFTEIQPSSHTSSKFLADSAESSQRLVITKTQDPEIDSHVHRSCIQSGDRLMPNKNTSLQSSSRIRSKSVNSDHSESSSRKYNIASADIDSLDCAALIKRIDMSLARITQHNTVDSSKSATQCLDEFRQQIFRKNSHCPEVKSKSKGYNSKGFEAGDGMILSEDSFSADKNTNYTLSKSYSSPHENSSLLTQIEHNRSLSDHEASQTHLSEFLHEDLIDMAPVFDDDNSEFPPPPAELLGSLTCLSHLISEKNENSNQ